MFQCDPSQGTDHLRTSVEESLQIQQELWGTLSGLAMPTLSLDIPQGGERQPWCPIFKLPSPTEVRKFTGWDGVEAEYRNPDPQGHQLPADYADYAEEWNLTKSAKTGISGATGTRALQAFQPSILCDKLFDGLVGEKNADFLLIAIALGLINSSDAKVG